MKSCNRVWPGVFCAVLFTLMFTAVRVVAVAPNLQETGSCPESPLSRLVVGEQGRVGPEGANNVRAEPSISGTLIGQIPGNGAFVVLDGPVCASGFAWWQIDYNGMIGWTAEGQRNDYWLEPAGPLPTQAATVTGIPTATQMEPQVAACPGFLPSRLVVGERGRVVPGPANNLRAEPASDTERVAEIPGGATFLVLEGPICAAGMAWWRVDYVGKVGWTPEGVRDVYWLEPAGPLPTLAPTLTPSITPTSRPTLTPMPTFTPIPAMPPVAVTKNLEALLIQPLPENREALTTTNIHRLQPLSIHGDGGISTLAITPDGTTLVVLNSLGVWLNSLDDTHRRLLLETPELMPTAIAISPDSRLLAIGSQGYTGMVVPTLQIWDLTTGEQLPLFGDFNGHIYALTFSPDGRQLAVGVAARSEQQNSQVFLLDVASERVHAIEMPFSSQFSSIVFSQNGELMAASSDYRTIELFSIAANEHQISYEVEGNLGDVRFSADGSLLFSAGGGGELSTPGVLRVWSTATSERTNSPRFRSDIRQLAISPSGTLMAIMAGGGDRVWLWDMNTMAQVSEINFPARAVTMTFAPDGKLLVGHVDGIVRSWDVQTGMDEVVLDYSGPEAGDRVEMSPDGHLLAIASLRHHEIQLWDSTTLERLGTFEGDLLAVSYLAFDADGTELHFTIGSRRYIWNLETGAQEQTATVFQPEANEKDRLMELSQ